MSRGRNKIDIDWRNFGAGMSTTNESVDGGFSPDSNRVEIQQTPGTLKCLPAPTDASTNLTERIIASCVDPKYSGQNRMVLDLGGSFYWLNGTTLTKKVTASSETYASGKTDFIAFNGSYYATTVGGDISEWDGATGLVEDWWTNASHLNKTGLDPQTAWRPLLVFEKHLWVGDRTRLHRIANDDTVSYGQIVLDTFESITALGTDPQTGYMLIGVTTGVNANNSAKGIDKILIYDGFSDKPLRSILVGGLVTAFHAVDGQVYVFYGNKVGLWNGAGISYLKTFDFANSSSSLAYPHHITSIDNTLYVADGREVLSYGEVYPGQKVWSKPTRNTASTEELTCLTAYKSVNLALSYYNSQLFVLDMTDTDNGTGGKFLSNVYTFEDDIYLREVDIEYDSNVASDESFIGTVNFYLDGQVKTYTSLSNDVSQLQVLTLNLEDERCRRFQLEYNFTDPTAIRRFTIYYDRAE